MELGSGESEEDDVDGQRKPLDGLDEAMAGLGEVRHTETGGQKDQHGIPLELVRDEGNEVHHADDEDQELLVDVANVERHQAADDDRTEEDRKDDVVEQVCPDAALERADAYLLCDDHLGHREGHDDDHVLQDDDGKHVARHRAFGPRLHDDGNRRRWRGGERHRRHHAADRERSHHRKPFDPRERDERHGAGDQPKEARHQHADRDELGDHDRSDHAEAALEPFELELAAGRQGDQGDRQGVEQAELLDDVVVEDALVEWGRKPKPAQRVGQRRPEDETRDEISGDVREPNLSD